MNRILLLVIMLVSFKGFSQVSEAGVVMAAGNNQGSVSLSLGKDWEWGSRKQFAIGVGGRFTSYVGSSQYYITAPAKLTSGSTGPLVIFKENIKANIDTFLISSPQVNAMNVFINLRYSLSDKFQFGFNIDLIGFSFGAKKTGTFIANGIQSKEEARPTSFNILLISDNDRGSLNSELYGKYYVSEKIGIKAGAQFLFTEYTTETKIQQQPESNDRFRNKSLMLAVGVVYRL